MTLPTIRNQRECDTQMAYTVLNTTIVEALLNNEE